MATRKQVEDYRRLNGDIVSLAQRDLDGFLARLDWSDTAAAREALIEFTDALVQTYGRPAALVAAQFYDDLRATSAGATGRYRAVMADGPTRSQIEGTVRWAMGQTDPADVLSGALQRYVSESGRNTIALNSGRDPSAGAWARVPSGLVTCDFCRMLASRGPVYRSAETAGQGTHYHDRCDCVPTQIWDGDDLPEGYDPDALYEEYQASNT